MPPAVEAQTQPLDSQGSPKNQVLNNKIGPGFEIYASWLQVSPCTFLAI